MSETRNSDVCFIVGFGPGLSFGIAQRFAREGFAIGAIGRGEAELRSYEDRLPAQHGGFSAAPADASKSKELLSAIESCKAKLGSCSVMIYNAAFMRDAPLMELSSEDLQTDFAVNVAGALTAAKAVLPDMRAAGSGTILFTGGGLALYQMPRMGALAIGKAGIRTLALTLAKELEPEGIHAATVTICGGIRAGTFYSPENIAEEFWKLHRDKPEAFRPEVVYSQEELDFPLHYQ